MKLRMVIGKLALLALISSAGHASQTFDPLTSSVMVEAIVKSHPISDSSGWTGSGFFVSKQGDVCIVATNRHVSPYEANADYKVRIHNGNKLKADYLYSDPLHDFAFLKVAKCPIDEISVVELTDKTPPKGATITTIGNPLGSFMIKYEGVISNNEGVTQKGIANSEAIYLSINGTSGASGSPIFDLNNKVIAIRHAGSSSRSIAVKASYLIDALTTLEQGKFPQRKTLGSLFQPIKKAAWEDVIPADLLRACIKDQPKFLLADDKIFQASQLEAGDILCAVDGKYFSSLYELEKYLNPKKKVKVKLLRDRQFIDKEITLFDFEKHRVRKYAEFANRKFFEGSSGLAIFSGIDSGVFMVDEKYGLVHIFEMHDQPINKIDDIFKLLPTLSQLEHFTLKGTKVMGKNKEGFSIFDSAYISNFPLEPDYIVIRSYEPYYTLYEFKDNSWHSSRY